MQADYSWSSSSYAPISDVRDFGRTATMLWEHNSGRDRVDFKIQAIFDESTNSVTIKEYDRRKASSTLKLRATRTLPAYIEQINTISK